MRALDAIVKFGCIKLEVTLSCFDQRFFPLERNAMLHAVNHDVIHSVELSKCHGIVAITVGGLTPPSAVCTDSVG
jgi:hypothetical protein